MNERADRRGDTLCATSIRALLLSPCTIGIIIVVVVAVPWSVGWKKSFFSILARISAAAALPSLSPSPSLSCAHHLVVKEFEFADRPTDRPHAHAV